MVVDYRIAGGIRVHSDYPAKDEDEGFVNHMALEFPVGLLRRYGVLVMSMLAESLTESSAGFPTPTPQ